MCEKLGESVTGPLTTAASGASTGVVTMNALCGRTECSSYGKWWCPFKGGKPLSFF